MVPVSPIQMGPIGIFCHTFAIPYFCYGNSKQYMCYDASIHSNVLTHINIFIHVLLGMTPIPSLGCLRVKKMDDYRALFSRLSQTEFKITMVLDLFDININRYSILLYHICLHDILLCVYSCQLSL